MHVRIYLEKGFCKKLGMLIARNQEEIKKRQKFVAVFRDRVAVKMFPVARKPRKIKEVAKIKAVRFSEKITRA
jgi:hypothetical protein